MAIEASAPGKVILFGEHSVVYRGPAVVLAIDKRSRVVADRRRDKKIFIDSENLGFSGYFLGDAYHPVRGEEWRGKGLAAINVSARKTLESVGVKSGLNLVIRSDIPSAVGLGSSAAICVATVAAVEALVEGGLSRDDICSLAYEGEKIVHGTPSGVDNNISTFGGIIKYEKGLGFERIKLDDSPPFIIGNTGRKRSTKKMVENVAALRERNTAIVDRIIDALGDVSGEGLSCLTSGDLRGMGELMNISHGLLTSLGVSSPQLDLLVYAARYEGALGAKLTGAGGGGCMIALAEDQDLKRVEEAILQERGDPIRIKISHEGVKTRKVG